MFNIVLLFLGLLVSPAFAQFTPANAQNVTCATRPNGDNSNACANTAWVNQNAASTSTPHTWTAPQTFAGGVIFPTTSYAQIVTTSTGASVFSPILDATAFGAVGDATTNNNAALAAISTQVSALHTAGYPGVEVRFPCGRFKATAQFSLSPTNGKNVTIKGGGNNCSELFFSGSNGIVVNLANQYASATVEDIGIVTDDTTGAYTAVRYSLPAGIVDPFNATNALNRVSLHGYDGYGTSTYWGIGFFQDKSSFVNLNDFNYAGATGNKGIGVKLQGDTGTSHFNVVTNVVSSNFAYYDKAIWYGTYYQGLQVTTTNFTGGAYGIYVPAGAAMVDQLSVTNSQFGQNATADIFLGSKMSAFIATGNLFIPRGTAIVTAGLVNSSITANSFQAYSAGVGTALNIGSSGDTAESVAISGNTILSLASGINIASGATAAISTNVIWNTTAPYTNSSSTTFQSGNIVNSAMLSSQLILGGSSGLPVSTGISGLGTGVATALGNATNASGGIYTYGTTLPASMEPAHTGDVTNSAGSLAMTLATVNSNVGSFGSATQAPQVTFNGKGLATAVSNVTITPAVGSITGLGSGVASALGNATGSANAVATLGSDAKVLAAQLPTPGFRNRLRNPTFAINQRVVSGTVTLAAGAYGHDGVKGGASGATYTFSTSGLDTTITVSAGSIILSIEDKLIEGGVYRLSQAGNAQARVWQGTGSTGSGSYAAAPFTTASLTANTQTNVEFSTGTVLRPQLELGTLETTFERRIYASELELAQRYYEKSFDQGTAPATNTGVLTGAEFAQALGATLSIQHTLRYKVEKRTAPIITLYNTNAANAQMRDQNTGADCSGTTALNVGTSGFRLFATSPGGAGLGDLLTIHWSADADLN